MALKQTSVSSQLGAADLPVCQTACRLTPQRTCSTSSAAPAPALRCRQVHSSAPHRQRQHLQPCSAVDPDKQASSWSVLPSRFNPAYAAIVGFYAALFALQNPYIFAALSIVTIIPQNSTTTSLNSLVILFYESGLFMNFAEAVYCVRLVTWLSILCCLASFSIFN